MIKTISFICVAGLLLFPTFAHSQTVIQFCNVRPEPSIEVPYLGKSNGDSIFGLRLAIALQNTINQHTSDISGLKATKVDASALVPINNDVQGLKNTKADKTYVDGADAILQSAINNIPGATIPVPLNITTSSVISAPYNTDIWCKPVANTKITLTIASQSPGWHYKIHNTGSGTVEFKGASGVTLINSVSMGKGRPLDISFQTATTAEIH